MKTLFIIRNKYWLRKGSDKTLVCCFKLFHSFFAFISFLMKKNKKRTCARACVCEKERAGFEFIRVRDWQWSFVRISRASFRVPSAMIVERGSWISSAGEQIFYLTETRTIVNKCWFNVRNFKSLESLVLCRPSQNKKTVYASPSISKMLQRIFYTCKTSNSEECSVFYKRIESL